MRLVTIIFIFLTLPAKVLSIYCGYHIDDQCIQGCYFYHGNCLPCTNCTKSQLVDLQRYHRMECTSFPAFCREQSGSVSWKEFATDFHPIQLPPLMGSFIGYDGRWLIMFFQEGMYAKIGKLCMNESQKVPTEWFTFQKSMLNCTGQKGVLYSNLVVVKNHSYNSSTDDSVYLALMSSSIDNKNQSALCLVRNNEIEAVFKDQTFRDPTVEDDWRAFPQDSIPTGSVPLGGCIGTSQLTDPQKNFIRTHQEKYNNVTAWKVLVEQDGLLTAVESVEKLRSSIRHKIIFLGTDDGRILKLSITGPDFTSNILEEIYWTPNASISITRIKIVEDAGSLQLKVWTTDAHEERLPLQRCSDMRKQCVCEQDPYCIWNIDDGSCRIFNSDHDSDSQPISKRNCEGIEPGSALLITNRYGRPIRGDGTTTTVDTETTAEEEKLEQPKDEEVVSGSSSGIDPSYLLGLCAIVGVIIFIFAGFVIYIRWFHLPATTKRDSQVLDWKSDWTTVTVNQKQPLLLLRDKNEGETEHKGEIVGRKTVFKDLKPVTEYTVSGLGESSPFIVKTEGPTFSEWVVAVDTVEVRVGRWDDPFNSYLVLKNDGRVIQRKEIGGSLVKFSNLPPNMNLEVWLEVSKKESEGVIEKHIKTVTTGQEPFTVIEVNGKPYLEWSNLSTRVERFIQSCSCGNFENFFADVDFTSSNSKELPPLPPDGKFCLKVMRKFDLNGREIFKHAVASVQFESRRTDLVKCPENSCVELPQESHRSEMRARESGLYSDDSSSRVNSAPVSEDLSEGSCDDSSTKIRSEPTLGLSPRLLGDCEYAEISRQLSVGNGGPTFIKGDNNQIYISCSLNGASSSGIGSLPNSQSSFSDPPLKDYVVQIGEECYQCSATLDKVTKLSTEEQKNLGMMIFICKNKAVECLCEVLNYSKERTDFTLEVVKAPEDCLNPIFDGEGVRELISISTLLYKLTKALKHSLQHNASMPREHLKEMKYLYSVIEFMANKVHKDCDVCMLLYQSAHHYWSCGGYEESYNKMYPPMV